MKFLSRVVWSEGMYLGPHHFQLQSRYFEDSIWFASSSLWFEAWGLAGCRLDPEALQNGTVSVLHARGIFPDGLTFQMPEADPLPAPRSVTELFPETADSVTVFLSVPQRQVNGLNCIPAESGDGAGVRFLAEPRNMHDETTGMDEKMVRIGRKNVQLLFDNEVSDNVSQVAVARITRDRSGHFVYDETFIPPCIRITASERLMFLLQRLIDILDDKSAALSPKSGRASGEYSTREIANFWFLHTVNSALPSLRHFFTSRHGHPEELYTEMARLAGALCTFAIDSHPRTIPPYNHGKLDSTFTDLDEHIRRHLETVMPSNCVSIPLAKSSDYFYNGEITDTRCLGPSRWILAIRSRIGEVELISRTPQLVKVCSSMFVPELVRRALPGMPMAHLPVPPSEISARLDTQYFAINRGGPCWEHMVKTRQAGVYVPGEIPEPELELLAILET